MRNVYSRILMFVFTTLLFAVSSAQIVSNNAFLKGNYVEVGMAPCGSFGTTVNSPAGYHPRGTTFLGFVADPAKDGWTVGNPNYVGDYFTPGTVEEGWGLTINGTSYNNNLRCASGTNQISGSIVNYTNTASEVSATWQGGVNGLSVTSRTYIPKNAAYFVTEVTLVNTAANPINNIYYMRNVDPDHGVATPGAGGSYNTINSIVQQNPNTCNTALATAVTLSGNNYLGLGSIDPRAKVTHGGFGNRSAINIWNGTGLNASGTASGDNAISISFNIGTLAPNQSTTFAYAYILSSSDLSRALASTNINVNTNGVSYVSGSTASVCSGGNTTLELTNTGTFTSWVWTPATGLNTTQGKTVIANVTSPITYIAKGTGPCGSVDIVIALAPTEGDSVGNAGVISGPSTFALGQTGITYSIAPVLNATNYVWTLPPGAVVTSGAGTNQITFNASNISWCGDITVTPSNDCNEGLASAKAICLGNILTTGAVSSPICDGTNFNVAYTATGIYNVGNVFTAQLSNASGSFVSPVNIGSLSGNNASGLIPVVIPAGTASGTNYRIRVVSNNLAGVGSDNGAPIVINQLITVSSNSPVVACSGTLELTASSGFASYAWAGPNDFISSSQNPTIATATTATAGIYTVTATTTTGCATTATINAVVQDNSAPTAVAQNATVTLDENGQASVVAEQVDNGSSDSCGITSLALSKTSFDCSNVGANTVTLTVTDVNGNVSTTTATVTVQDNTAPTAVAQDVTVTLDANGQTSVAATQVNNGSFDNCSIASLVLSKTSFDCSNVGANPVTLTVTDVNGNVSTATATVTVQDNTAPTAVAQDVTVVLGANGQASLTAAQVNNGSSDNCGVASVVLSKTTFDCSNVGANPVTLTVTDINGNVSTKTATVFVTDTLNPEIIPYLVPPTTKAISQQGRKSTYTNVKLNGGINVLTVTPGSSVTLTGNWTSAYDGGAGCSGCVTQHYIGVNNLFSTCHTAGSGSGTLNATFNAPTTPGIYYITQTSTWWYSCNQYGTPAYGSDPNTAIAVLIVSGGSSLDISSNVNATICGAVVNYVTPSAKDNCAGVTLQQISGLASGSIFPLGTTTNTWVATDLSGNTSTYSFSVHVTDTRIPTVTVKNKTAYLDVNGTVSINVTDIDNGSTDGCGIDTMYLSKTTFNCSNVGANTVTLTVTDAHNNTATKTATVTIVDNIAPTAIAQPVTIYLDENGQASVTAAQVNNGSFDNCSVASLVLSKTSFDCSSVGANLVTLTVTDVNGNTSTATATVTVQDNTAPSAVAQNVIVYLDENGQASVTEAQVNNGSSDNCGVASVVLDKTTFDCSNVGANTVTLTVTDVNGNTSTATATVTVQDNIAPTAVVQNVTVTLDANGQASITAAQVDNGSSDNCGIASLELSKTTFDCSNVGANPVTLTVTDVNGNVSTATATVTAQDNTAPTAVAQNVTVTLDANGQVSVTAAQVNNGSFDNCSVASLVLSKTSFDCSNVGANPVTLTVTDVNGNVSTATATVTVQDNTAPIAVAQNVTVTLDVNGQASVSEAQVNNGSSDNCSVASVVLDKTTFDCSSVGANLVTLTITDVNGNVSTATATVTVQDNMTPTAVAQDVTVVLGANGQASVTAAQVNNGSFDNCSVASLVLSKTSFDCSNVGANPVTLTVTDVNGNVSTATATVTVQDNTAPTAVAQDVTVTLDANGQASVTEAQVNNGSSDNCGVASVVLDKTTFDCSNIGANTVALTVTDVNGNVSTAIATVTVIGSIPSVSITATPNNSTNTGGVPTTLYLGYGPTAVTLSASGSFVSREWSGIGLSSTSVATPTFTPTAAGSYTFGVTVTNNYGCTATASITICVIDARISPSSNVSCMPLQTSPYNCNTGTSIANGTNNINIHDGQTYYIAAGVNFTSGSINLNGGTLIICGSVAANANLNVNKGLLVVNSGATFARNSLNVNGGVTLKNYGTVNVNGTLIVNNILQNYKTLNVTGGVTVNGNGLLENNGGTVSIGGDLMTNKTVVNKGVMTVSGNNITVNGGGKLQNDCILIWKGNMLGNGSLTGSMLNPLKVYTCKNGVTSQTAVSSVASYLSQNPTARLGSCSSVCGSAKDESEESLANNSEYDSAASTAELLEGNELQVYPNPFTQAFTVEINATTDAKASILLMDVVGKLVKAVDVNITLGVNKFNITELNNVQSGVYFMKVEGVDGLSIVKVVKE